MGSLIDSCALLNPDLHVEGIHIQVSDRPVKLPVRSRVHLIRKWVFCFQAMNREQGIK